MYQYSMYLLSVLRGCSCRRCLKRLMFETATTAEPQQSSPLAFLSPHPLTYSLHRCVFLQSAGRYSTQHQTEASYSFVVLVAQRLVPKVGL